MMKAPAFLGIDEVLRIHERVTREFGGHDGVRDRGLLESAVAMPSAGLGGTYLHDGIQAMAAAYLFHLCQNHPFLDGNKRVALATAEMFLNLNGVGFTATGAQLEKLTLDVAAGTMTKDSLTRFFRKHTRRYKK